MVNLDQKIPFVDLRTQYLRIKDEIDNAIQDAVDGTAYINGPQVKQFAQELSEYLGGSHVVPCANGTDALQIALMALELEPGDEVILPVHTYVATAEVIALLRLKPVFVDVDADRFTLDPELTEKVITSKTKAIVPVHLYGQGADMERLIALAGNHGIPIIEDNAQGIGGDYTFSNGTTKKLGTMTDIGTTSFFPAKNLGAFGDGGALFIGNPQLAERARLVANHGQSIKYHHDLIGCNSRLDSLQAAILSVKLRHLDDFTSRRRALAAYYDEQLGSISDLKVPTRFKDSSHVFHQYTLTLNGEHPRSRDDFKQYLADRGIPSVIYYPVPLHYQKGYLQYGYKQGDFPVTEQLVKSILSLPMHTEMPDDQRAYIVECIKEYF